jgi:hypothetical protein
VTIDPGKHTAIACWEYGNLSSVTTYTGDAYTVANALALVLHTTRPSAVIIEGVDVRTSDARSLASAARGNLSTLAYCVGALEYVSRRACVEYTDIIRFIDWAGQLNYTQLRAILAKKFSISVTNDHCAAAVGIGLWAKGAL